MIELPLKGYDEIIKLVPQRAPALMLDAFIEADDRQGVSVLLISEENLYCRELHLSVPGLIENMAQTAAAHNGYMNLKRGHSAMLGYIVAVKNLKIDRLPAAGETLRTEIVIKHEVMDYIIVMGRIHVQGVQIAGCELRIYIPGKDGTSGR